MGGLPPIDDELDIMRSLINAVSDGTRYRAELLKGAEIIALVGKGLGKAGGANGNKDLIDARKNSDPVSYEEMGGG